MADLKARFEALRRELREGFERGDTRTASWRKGALKSLRRGLEQHYQVRVPELHPWVIQALDFLLADTSARAGDLSCLLALLPLVLPAGPPGPESGGGRCSGD